MVLAESRRRRIETRRTLLISGLAWILVAGLQVSGLLESFELRLLDWRFRLRGERPASESITLVCVDDATIRGYGAWPIPRDAYALLLAALTEGGARAVGVDLQFPDDPRQSAESNQLLAQVSEAHGVVHAMWFQADDAAPPSSPQAGSEEALARHGVPADRATVAGAAAVALPYAMLLEGASSLGHISAAMDPDGAFRRLPIVVRYRGSDYPALSLRLAGLLRGEGGLEAIEPAPGGLRVRWREGSMRIPTGSDGTTRIDYAGDRRAFPVRHSMLEVLQWYRSGDLSRIRETFGGRAVLIGLTAREEISEDIGPTPFSSTTSMVMMHANALDNLIRGRFLTGIGVPLHLVALLGVALALGLLFTRLSIPAAAAVAAGTMVGLAALDQALLAWAGLDVPVLPGLILPALAYAATGSARHFLLQRHSERREEEIREGFTVQQRFLPDALVGRSLSHYRIEEMIGSGGMGAVYRGRDTVHDREVAIKVLLGGALADPGQRNRFRREARLHARFSHPGAAAFYDIDSQDGADFLVMEFVPGISLAEHLRKGPLPEREALRIAAEITEVLVEAHALDIVHRDIKPANVMISPKGRARLLDFGVALLTSASGTSATLALTLTDSGAIIGTPAYMAPELILGQKATASTDLYGIGMVLFEMTTARRPFPDDHPHELMHLILNQPPPHPRVLNARLTEPVENIILRALEKLPENRFASAQEMLAALRSAGQ